MRRQRSTQKAIPMHGSAPLPQAAAGFLAQAADSSTVNLHRSIRTDQGRLGVRAGDWGRRVWRRGPQARRQREQRGSKSSATARGGGDNEICGGAGDTDWARIWLQSSAAALWATGTMSSQLYGGLGCMLGVARGGRDDRLDGGAGW
ncbi:hypothetical protein ABZP36_020258 [Zizania latifolia]